MIAFNRVPLHACRLPLLHDEIAASLQDIGADSNIDVCMNYECRVLPLFVCLSF